MTISNSSVFIKYSETSGEYPTSLGKGELFINIPDNKLFSGNGSSSFSSALPPAGVFIHKIKSTESFSDYQAQFFHKVSDGPDPSGNPVNIVRSQVWVDATSDKYWFALQGEVDQGVVSTGDHVGVVGRGARNSSATGTSSALWGGYFEVSDLTGRKSSVSGGDLYGVEVDIFAGGPDDAGNRRMVDLWVHPVSSADGNAVISSGVRVANQGNFQATIFSTITEAFVADGRGYIPSGGSIVRSFVARQSSTGAEAGFLSTGTAANLGEFVAQLTGSSTARIRLETDMSAAANAAGAIEVYGKNSSSTAVKYCKIASGPWVSTTGSEAGYVQIMAPIGGASDQTLFAVNGDTATYLRFAGATRELLVGAADSAGTGYRSVRVAN